MRSDGCECRDAGMQREAAAWGYKAGMKHGDAQLGCKAWGSRILSPPNAFSGLINSIIFFSTTQILANQVTDINDRAGRRYFEGSLKFQATLTKILNMLTRRVKRLAEDDIYGANVSQFWGIGLLLFVMMLSPILIILAKNAISSIQLFAGVITYQ